MKLLQNSICSTHMQYHLDNEISILNNIFRYGSEAWADLITEARTHYDAGNCIELEAEEFETIKSDMAIKANVDGVEVLLDTPEVIWDHPELMEVYTKIDNYIKRIEFPNTLWIKE